MRNTLVLSVAMAFLWMIFAAQVSIEGFIVGYIFGFAVLWVLRLNTSIEDGEESLQFRRIPSQVIALSLYILILGRDVILSGIDVAKKVLQAQMPINPGVHRISTQDSSNHLMISGLSAHGITITPGELVIDFETDENGQTLMLVHALDHEASSVEKLAKDQKNRLVLIRQILGFDANEEK